MRIEERPIQNPKTENIYIARDNKEFRSEKQCLEHEMILNLKDAISHINYKKVDIINSLSDGNAYYITNEDDFKAVVSYFCRSYPYGYECGGDWDYIGETWYIFSSENGGCDYPDTLYCETLNYYKERIQKFLEQFN